MPTFGDEAADDAVVVAAVEVQRLDVGEQATFGGGGEGGFEQDAVVAVGAVGGPADGDAVAVGEQRPLPAAFAPVDRGWARFLRRRWVLCAGCRPPRTH